MAKRQFSIRIDEAYLEYLEDMVSEGKYDTVSDCIRACIELMMKLENHDATKKSLIVRMPRDDYNDLRNITGIHDDEGVEAFIVLSVHSYLNNYISNYAERKRNLKSLKEAISEQEEELRLREYMSK